MLEHKKIKNRLKTSRRDKTCKGIKRDTSILSKTSCITRAHTSQCEKAPLDDIIPLKYKPENHEKKKIEE